MDFNNVPIMIVDDTKVSQVMLERLLRRTNFHDIRVSRSGSTALKALEERPASVVFIDLIMPEMGGLELAKAVRTLDESIHHFSYLIIVTAQDSFESFQNAFIADIDDFVSKSELSTQLVPRTLAGIRTSITINSLLNDYQRILEAFREQKQLITVDPATGLSTRRCALEQIDKIFHYLEARGGHLTIVVIKIENLSSFDDLAKADLHIAIAQRLRHYFRSLDTICFLEEGIYASIMHSVEPTQANSFRRVHDGLNHRAFKVYNGYADIQTTAKVLTMTKAPPDISAQALIDQCLRDINSPDAKGRLFFTDMDLSSNTSTLE